MSEQEDMIGITLGGRTVEASRQQWIDMFLANEALRAENERLRGLLAELVEVTGPLVVAGYAGYLCNACDDVNPGNRPHKPDCPWLSAKQYLEQSEVEKDG